MCGAVVALELDVGFAVLLEEGSGAGWVLRRSRADSDACHPRQRETV